MNEQFKQAISLQKQIQSKDKNNDNNNRKHKGTNISSQPLPPTTTTTLPDDEISTTTVAVEIPKYISTDIESKNDLKQQNQEDIEEKEEGNKTSSIDTIEHDLVDVMKELRELREKVRKMEQDTNSKQNVTTTKTDDTITNDTDNTKNILKQKYPQKNTEKEEEGWMLIDRRRKKRQHHPHDSDVDESDTNSVTNNVNTSTTNDTTIEEQQSTTNEEKKQNDIKEDEIKDSTPPITIIRSTINIPIEKRGLIMGKNGATLKKINEVCNTQIQIPRSDSTNDDTVIEGTSDEIEIAKTIIKEILDNGYSTILNPELICSKIRVPLDKRSIVLGPSGIYIKKIREATNCKILLPERQSTSEIAEIIGLQKDVDIVINALETLMTDGYSTITHETWSTIDISFPLKYRKQFTSNSNLRKDIIYQQCKVQFPSTNDDIATIIGPFDNLQKVAESIRYFIEELDTPVVNIIEQGFEPPSDDELNDATSW